MALVTNKTTTSSANNSALVAMMQSELDALKEGLTDQVYKTLCDKLMEINKTESSKSNTERVFYEFTVCVPRLVPEGSDERSFELTIEPEKRIKSLVRCEGENWMREIKTHGFKHVASHFFFQHVRHKDDLHVHDMCDDCEEVSHISIEISYPTLMVIGMSVTES